MSSATKNIEYSIESKWKSFAERVVDPEEENQNIEALRQAFFAGAAALAIIMNIMGNDNATIEDLNKLNEEIRKGIS